ncbi:MAG TPA: hypothetical protein VHB97_02705 [Polyangia bacterium]|jgi:hypothetical protein|nr:hypothetical protein [Polyangia bacterium]
MRQADVEDALRVLQRARDAAERAHATRDQAVAARAALQERMQRLHAKAARTAGQLGLRDHYRAQLRSQLDSVDERMRATGRAFRAATQAVAAAQQQVELALRAREAAEAQRNADEKLDARKRERRDQAAADDRWRPPRRS